MAVVYASASGNWSTMTWWSTSTGGVTSPPGSGDNVDLNGQTVTVDINITVSGIVGAGALAVTGNRTINANCGSDASSWSCSLGATGQTVTINGIVTAGTATKFSFSGGTLFINGDIYGGVAGSAWGILANSGSLSVAGNLHAGSGSFAVAMLCNGSATTITGNATSAASVALQVQNGVVTLNGNATAAAAHGINLIGGTLSVNGTLTGTAANSTLACGASVSAGTLNINGTVAAGSGAPAGLGQAPFGVLVTGGTANVTANLIDQPKTSALVVAGGTLNYTPTNSQTADIGGKLLQPQSAGGKIFVVED